MRGAWIEIGRVHQGGNCGQRRSPCGERGLKSPALRPQHTRELSLPVRGAWIEMRHAFGNVPSHVLSLPVRGAWIEIGGQRAGERMGEVAPRAGSVD